MRNILVYPVGCTPASHIAAGILAKKGIEVTDHITPDATHLLMDVPSLSGKGLLKSGVDLQELLSPLSPRITLIGGMLPGAVTDTYPAIDLLKDDMYLYENAALTAECALRVAAEKMNFSLRKAPVLVVGWGRIGKHLAFLLKAYGAKTTILSRSAAHRTEAVSFGFSAVSPGTLPDRLKGFRIIFNTAPGMVLPAPLCAQCGSCLKIDLASVPGMEGTDVIPARGLPGIHVPESSGQLIADTVLRRLREEQI